MYITLYKNNERVTTLLVGIHGDTTEDVKAYAKANFEYDDVKEQSEEEHAKEISMESQPTELTEKEEKELDLNQTLHEINEEAERIKREYVTASLIGDEELKEELKEEYRELMNKEL